MMCNPSQGCQAARLLNVNNSECSASSERERERAHWHFAGVPFLPRLRLPTSPLPSLYLSSLSTISRIISTLSLPSLLWPGLGPRFAWLRLLLCDANQGLRGCIWLPRAVLAGDNASHRQLALLLFSSVPRPRSVSEARLGVWQGGPAVSPWLA